MAKLGKFTHLHAHSHYSTLDGANRLEGMVERAKGMGMGAIALTDHGHLFGALAFQKAAAAGGIKPIFGSELYLSPTTRTDRTSPQATTRHHLILLCENLEGYRNLSRLTSKAYLEGHYYKPRIDMEILAKYSKGLICSSACIQGPVAQAILKDTEAKASQWVDDFVQIFGRDNFFLEMMDHGLEEQHLVNQGMLKLAKKHGLGLVATNDCHYATHEAAAAHDILLCIQTGKTLDSPNRLRYATNEFYIKSPDQMIALFGEVKGAIDNTVAIAERCDCTIPTGQKLLPRFKTPEGKSAAEYLRQLVREGLDQRYGNRPPPDRTARADHEVAIIESMGFVDYFLVVWDFIRWAKTRTPPIPVGPGRGSGAGSIVAYCLEITDLDPIEHGLLFERFLNPERVSMPDFDIDFCYERRSEVIGYVRQKYGEGCVAQIITFGTMKARNSIRDVGRVMGMELPKVDRVAKLVPAGPKVTLAKALEEVQDLRDQYESDPEVKLLIDRAQGVEGAIRQPGTHAAGIVISDQPLIDLIPLYKPQEEGALPATQFTMTEVEEIGLLKMDFLGLKNLTIIDRCLKSVNERFGKCLKAEEIPLDDPETYELLQAGKGLGLFQFESAGMRDLLVNFKPTKFSDLAVITSLYRPGPMDSIPEFIARKEGRTPITYDHPDMEPILSETYGLFVYQEQVMQVPQVLAGYSLGGADILRRAMSKKKHEEMAKERDKFVTGCRNNSIDEETATRIFDTMEKFAAYGFNKSHGAAYSVISVQTAYLKRHWPVDFYAALLTNEIGGDDAKIAMYFAEARAEGIGILPPDINTSGLHFTPDGDLIRFGLSAVKGVGEGAVEAIIVERANPKKGPFSTLQDFVTRGGRRHINARTVECLIKCGAFDAMGHNRPSLLAALPKIMEVAGATRREEDDPQISLFDMMDEQQTADLNAEVPIESLADWTDRERLATEKELAGFYLSGHPLERFDPDFAAFSTATAAELRERSKGETVEWVGLVRRLVSRTDRNGRMFAFAECEDMSGPLECTFFSAAFDRYRPLLVEGEILWIRGRLDTWRDAIKIIVQEARPIDEVRSARIGAIEAEMTWQQVTEANLERLREIIRRHKGRRKLWLLMRDGPEGGEVRIEAGAGFGIQPGTPLVRELQDVDCIQGLRFVLPKSKT